MRLDRLAVERAGTVATVTLSGGPLTAREAAELVAVVEDLGEDDDLTLLALRSASPDFCPGPASDLDPLSVVPDPPGLLAALTVPVVAAVAGAATGVGCELVLGVDVVVAASTARFSLPDVQAGRLPCWGGTQRLARAAGHARASALVLTGDVLDARSALEAGVVHRVVDDGELEEALAATLDQLGALAPRALGLAKEAVARGADLTLADGLRLEGDLNHLLQTTTDRAEGLAAFFDKRPPRFEGR